MTSSGMNGFNIITNASPKWDRTRCPFDNTLNSDALNFMFYGKYKYKILIFLRKLISRYAALMVNIFHYP